MPRRSHPSLPVLVFVLSALSAYLCAAVFIVVNQLSLPTTDLAYGQPLIKTFTDPFVVLVAGTGASVAALLIFPVAAYAEKRRDLVRCGVFVLSLTILF